MIFRMQLKSNHNFAVQILDILKKEYKVVKPALEYNNPFELLISTILSAQCTDERVNSVTKDLFKKIKHPSDFIEIDNNQLEKLIFSTGYYKQKAKNIKACCESLVKDHGGKVPNDFNELVKLSGVGRKSASVIAGNAFGIPSIAVDTHVKRLSNLLGFVNTKNPDKIEFRMKEILPESYWIGSSHLLASHGKKVCIANKPKCIECVVADLCPSNKKF